MTKPETALRELAERIFPLTDNEEFYNTLQESFRKELIEGVTALISEHYYPKEFTEWVGKNNAILCYVNIRKIWVRTRFVLGENPHEEYDEYTTEELFEYWKINKQ